MNKRLWIDYTKVRGALDFGTVLSHYGIEYQAGKNQVKILCQFHEEKTPSLSINMEDGKFQCFGCGAKGNTLEFLMLKEGKDAKSKDELYEGAMSAIALIGRSPEEFVRSAKHSDAPKRAPKAQNTQGQGLTRLEPQTPRSDDPGEPGKVPESATNPVLKLELTLDPEHSFLFERGITAEVARAFGLGFCSQGIMKDRIAIPIHNERGELVAYAGRYASEEVPEGIERYRLPKKFYKSLVLFNLFRAKALGKRHLVLVEGFWSAIRFERMGIAAAALLGTTCSEHQAELIRGAGVKFVSLMLDGDAAGRKALPEVVNVLARKVYVRVVELPDGQKPDAMPAEFLEQFR